MKKLLFSLVAAAACGAVTAAPVEFTDLTAFDPLKNDADAEVGEDVPGYWEINYGTEPELAVSEKVEEQDVALGYLKINTGSTPLWRTFSGVESKLAVTNATLDATAVSAANKVVKSKVKLTACTEWPTLADFKDEKFALFLFDAEDGDTSGMDDGLYAVGGAYVTEGGNQVFTNKAYKLNLGGAALADSEGWTTVTIKAYDNILASGDGVAGFLVAIGSEVVTVDDENTDYSGFAAKNLTPVAATRLGKGQLIPAYARGATLQGLGFQGEGCIDDVDLEATAVAEMADAIAFTVAGDGANKATFGNDLKPDQNSVITVPVSVTSVSFTLNLAENEQATVTYKSGATPVGNLTKNGDTYTFAPVANATLTITVETLLYQANGKGYATFTEALTAALAADGKVTLLGAVALEEKLEISNTVTLDLGGKTISGELERDALIKVAAGGSLTIIDSVGGGAITPDNGNAVDVDTGVLVVNAGTFDGAIVLRNNGTATINGGKFAVKVETATIPGDKKWSDLTEGYYTLVNKGGDAPTVDDENATITPDGQGNYVVETEEESLEINLPENFDKKVVIPATVNSVSGVAIGQLKVMATVTVGETTQSFDIAGVLKIENGKLVLDETKAKPALAEEDPFVVGDTTAVSVQTIPGLKYSLVYDSDLSFESDAKGETAAVPATTTSMTLTDDSESKPTKRFYKVKVTK